jgi:hypothetical protein
MEVSIDILSEISDKEPDNNYQITGSYSVQFHPVTVHKSLCFLSASEILLDNLPTAHNKTDAIIQK